MDPRDASETMRQEADHMALVIRGIKAKKPSEFTNKDLVKWLCIALQQHSDFKLSMADVIQSMSETYPGFELTAIPTKAEFKMDDESDTANLETPPFDFSFWMGLGDV